MKINVSEAAAKAEDWLPESKRDGSGVGVNYVDQCLKGIKQTLEDGRKVSCKRRGLKLTLTAGDAKGEGLLRRLDSGPDVKAIFQAALREAAANAGLEVSEEHGQLFLQV